MLASWMYTSQPAYDPSQATRIIAEIENSSIRRNLELKVTGALVFAGHHIAQYIEGPAPSVELLRASISADPRHHRICFLSAEPLAQRRFTSWRVAYQGLARYVEKAIIASCHDADAMPDLASNALLQLLQRFSADDAARSTMPPDRPMRG